MADNEIAFLVATVTAFVLLGGALAWASWMESRPAKGGRK
jgi:hypothetical protein